MADFTFGGMPNIRMNFFQLAIPRSVDLVNADETQLYWLASDGSNLHITGTDLEPEVKNHRLIDLTAGTITGIHVQSGKGPHAEVTDITGLSLDAATFEDVRAAKHWKDLLNLILTGNDTVHGTQGNDRLLGGVGKDVLFGMAGTDKLEGGVGNDRLVGGTGHDTLFGLGSNDRLEGGLGNDSLDGGLGKDVLLGGTGSDVLTGGAGADTFVFDTRIDASFDTITDFQHGIDHIRLDKSFFGNVGPVGVMGAAHFHVGAAADRPLQGVIYDSETGFLYSDRDGKGPAVAHVFAHLEAGLTLTASDFLIVA